MAASPESDLERFELLKKECSIRDFHPNNASISLWLKSNDGSKERRHLGNVAYGEKDCRRALDYYNEAVLLAPFPDQDGLGGSELSLAFGNRSAVLFELKDYKKCLLNINRALQFGYPKDKSFKLFERQTKCFIALGYQSDAVKRIVKGGSEVAANQTQADGVLNEMMTLDLNLGEDQSQIDLSDPDPWTAIPDISGGSNLLIPSASNAISLIYDEEKGRRFKADRDIRIGEVLIVEPAYAFALDRSHLTCYCFHCMKRCSDPYPCQQCSFVCYCSEECATLSWSTCHQFECLMLCHLNNVENFLNDDKFFNTCVMSIRMILLAGPSTLLRLSSPSPSVPSDPLRCSLNKDGVWVSRSFEAISQLVSLVECTCPTRLKQYEVLSFLMIRLFKSLGFIEHCLQFRGENNSPLTPEDFEFYLWQFIVKDFLIKDLNGYTIGCAIVNYKTDTSRSLDLGHAIYVAASFLNHSCCPNTIRDEYGTTLVIRAGSTIKKDQEVTINYTAPYFAMSQDKRQAICQESYHFTCQCEACLGDWPVYRDSGSPTKVVFGCVSCSYPTLTRCEICSKLVSPLIEEYNKLNIELETFVKGYIDKGYPKEDVAALLQLGFNLYDAAEKCVLKPSCRFYEIQMMIIIPAQNRLTHCYFE